MSSEKLSHPTSAGRKWWVTRLYKFLGFLLRTQNGNWELQTTYHQSPFQQCTLYILQQDSLAVFLHLGRFYYLKDFYQLLDGHLPLLEPLTRLNQTLFLFQHNFHSQRKVSVFIAFLFGWNTYEFCLVGQGILTQMIGCKFHIFGCISYKNQ